MRESMWHCNKSHFHKLRFPAKGDITRLKGVSEVWSLSHDKTLRTIASTIEAIGIRKCPTCGEKQVVVIFSSGGWWYQTFSYDLDSEVGKRFQFLREKDRGEKNE